MKTLESDGAKELLMSRLRCIRESITTLQGQIDSTNEQRAECCGVYENVIMMNGAPVRMNGESITME